MRMILLLSTLPLLCLAQHAVAVNENTTIVLHAVDTAHIPCNQIEIDGTDCTTTVPVIDVTGMSRPSVLVLLRNYDDAFGVQCAFMVPASWVFTYGLWECLVQLPESNPRPPWGPLHGTISLGFGDPIVGGTLAPLGRMHFAAAAEGCMEIIESSFPYGTHVTAPSGAITPIAPVNRARICVGPGGHDACDPIPVPVSTDTWGRIKSSYDTSPRPTRDDSR